MPGASDYVSYIDGWAPSPAGTDVAAGSSFNILGLFVSGLDTAFVLHGNTNTIGSNVIVQGIAGADNPANLVFSGAGTVNVGATTYVGNATAVDANLIVTAGATFDTHGLGIGDSVTKGAVAVDGGTLNAGTVDVGTSSPAGVLKVSSGSLNVTDAGGMTVGNYGGNGAVVLDGGGTLGLSAGILSIGVGGDCKTPVNLGLS